MLDELKSVLGIIDTDQDVDLGKIILRGKAHLEGITGTVLNFEVDGLSKSLLLDFCRYSFNNASEYFEENFSGQILRLQLQSAVIDYATVKT